MGSPKLRRFPTIKRAEGQRGNAQVDVEKVKEMYLSGTHYRWADFCQKEGFPAGSKTNAWFKEHVDWESWKREWLRRKNIVMEEEISPEMLNTTRTIALHRIKFVDTWSAISKNMKALLTHLMNEHIIAAADDQARAETIRMGLGKKKLDLTIDQLSEFAAAGNRIAELEARALMIVSGDKNRVSHELEAAAEEADKPIEFEYQTIGTTLNAQERTRMLAEYFDQFQKPAEIPAIAVEVTPDGAEDPG